ncbi:MAG: hypothetical protein ACUZ8I_17600 [Candidatus Scalindua sp.]
MKRLRVVLLVCLIASLNIGSSYAGTIKGKISSPRLRNFKDALVYIEKIEGKVFPSAEKAVVMDQVALVFIPRVIPIVKGSVVNFRNSDTVLHSVFAVGDDEFDLGTWTGDVPRNHTFNKLGEIAILCNVHPEMEAYVVVLQNPYFGLTDEDGAYKIDGVPAGKYTLKTWHDRLRPVTKEIEVTEGELIVDLEIKR